jgi:hypothetical protein
MAPLRSTLNALLMVTAVGAFAPSSPSFVRQQTAVQESFGFDFAEDSYENTPDLILGEANLKQWVNKIEPNSFLNRQVRTYIGSQDRIDWELECSAVMQLTSRSRPRKVQKLPSSYYQAQRDLPCLSSEDRFLAFCAVSFMFECECRSYLYLQCRSALFVSCLSRLDDFLVGLLSHLLMEHHRAYYLFIWTLRFKFSTMWFVG